MDFKYHTIGDEQQIRFYQTPKTLFGNARYKGLGIAEKQIYAILRDRQDLSRKNNWVDENGHIFLMFSVDNLAELTEVSRNSIMRYKKTLAEYGLIKEVSTGIGKPNRIYVGQVLQPDTRVAEVDQSKIETLTSSDLRPGVVQNWDCNDTDISETENSETDTTTTIGGDEEEDVRVDTVLIMKKWNELPESIPKIMTLGKNTKRYKSLKSRVEEFGEDNVLRAINNVSRSNFLQGDNNRKWTVDFDWFIRPNNFIKVLEGNYENKDKPSGNLLDEMVPQDVVEWFMNEEF